MVRLVLKFILFCFRSETRNVFIGRKYVSRKNVAVSDVVALRCNLVRFHFLSVRRYFRRSDHSLKIHPRLEFDLINSAPSKHFKASN